GAPGAITLDQATSELAGRGWLTRDGAGQYALGPAGEAAHAAVQEKIYGIRAQFLMGLTEDDYLHTVLMLQRMAANLERAAATGRSVPQRAARNADPAVAPVIRCSRRPARSPASGRARLARPLPAG